MDYRLTPNEDQILVWAIDIVARNYHQHRRESNKRYKPKPNHDGPLARELRTLVSLSRRQHESGLTTVQPTT